MPCEGRERECGEREKTQQQPARGADDRNDAPAHQRRQESHRPGGPAHLREGRIERPGWGRQDHSQHEGNEQGEPARQNRRALHVEAREPIEAGEGDAEAEQRDERRAHPKGAPERLAEHGPEPAGLRVQHQRQGHEQPGDQRGERAESPAGIGCHDGCSWGAMVIRRSWKYGSTG
jgi:hypothetical protein